MKDRIFISLFLTLFFIVPQRLVLASTQPAINMLLLSKQFQMVKDIYPGSDIGNYQFSTFYIEPVIFRDLLFFAADDNIHGVELWCTNGTDSGTFMVSDINPGSEPSIPSSFVEFNDALYFFAYDNSNGLELHKTIFNEIQLQWNTSLVKDINPGADGSVELLERLTIFNGALYFSADDGTNGKELWQSNGTEAGTKPVFDLNPGPGSSNPRYLTSYNNALVFKATNGSSGDDLWKLAYSVLLQKWTTYPIKDIGPNGGNIESFVTYFPEFNNELYFFANDGLNGEELWKTDGTLAGTYMVKDISPDTPYNQLADRGGFALFNNEFYFVANDGYSNELWKTDGTTAGTIKASNLLPPNQEGFTHILANFNNSLYFHTIGTDGQELAIIKLWRRVWSQATNSWQTILVKEFDSSGSPILIGLFYAINGQYAHFDDALYISGYDSSHGAEIWKVDQQDTAALVRDLNPGKGDFGPWRFIEYNSRLYFWGNDGTHGLELWRWNQKKQ